jgi:hypothetical protein
MSFYCKIDEFEEDIRDSNAFLELVVKTGDSLRFYIESSLKRENAKSADILLVGSTNPQRLTAVIDPKASTLPHLLDTLACGNIFFNKFSFSCSSYIPETTIPTSKSEGYLSSGAFGSITAVNLWGLVEPTKRISADFAFSLFKLLSM